VEAKGPANITIYLMQHVPTPALSIARTLIVQRGGHAGQPCQHRPFHPVRRFSSDKHNGGDNNNIFFQKTKAKTMMFLQLDLNNNCWGKKTKE